MFMSYTEAINKLCFHVRHAGPYIKNTLNKDLLLYHALKKEWIEYGADPFKKMKGKKESDSSF